MRKQSIPGCLSPPMWPGYEANYGLPTASAVGLIIGEVVGLLVIVVVMKREKFKGECCNFQLVFEPILVILNGQNVTSCVYAYATIQYFLDM